MSDTHFNDPSKSNGNTPQQNAWDQDPFPLYDDPFINPEGTGAPLTEDPPATAAPPEEAAFRPYTPPVSAGGASEPAFRRTAYTAEPSEHTAYTAAQQVTKRTTPARAAAEEPAAPRRRSRMERYHDAAGQDEAPAGTQPGRRQTEPDSRYSGARTARPQDGGPTRRPGMRDPYRAPLYGDETRPQPGTQQPAPQQVPPARPKPIAITRPPEESFGWTKPNNIPPVRTGGGTGTGGGRPPKKNGRGLWILLIVLLVIGGLFAGIWLPDWGSKDGALAQAMSSAQSAIKGLIMPEEIVIRAFSVQPDTGTAPAELSFVVYASTATETIRVLDDQQKVLLEKTISDQDRLVGNVTKNSDGNNIWKLRYTFDGAYTGNLAVQAQGSDGTWDVEGGMQQYVSIAAPAAVYDPPIQDFLCSAVADEVPANVSFSIVTSPDVSAVRVVNDYGDVVAELTVNDAGINMTETGDTRVWTLEGTFAQPYTGSLYVGYELIVGEGYTQSDYRENVEYTPAPIPEETEPAETATPAPTEAPTPEPTATPAPTPEPTATPEPEPTATPSPTLMPLLTAEADGSENSGVISLTSTAYKGSSKISDYSRTDMINMLDAEKYAIWDQSGVLTFRGGPLRQNAAYGTVEMEKEAMKVLWKVPMEGAMRMSGATLTGVGWPGQAAIVKWPTEVRQLLNLYDDAKAKTALKEVIVGAQNGTLYFLDLTTGELTRDPVDINWPSNGAVSVYTDGSPIAAFGQFYSIKADKKQIDNGLHIFSLLNDKQLALVNGREKPKQTNYSGFSGAPLFDKATGAMIEAGQNGVLYLVDFNTDFDYIGGTLSISPTYHRYLWNASKQSPKNTNVDGSVAVYGQYAYWGDDIGILQCVDINTLEPVWAVRAGDDINGTPALDLSADGETLSLYVGTVMENKTGTPARFYSYNALTGAVNWTFDATDLTYVSSDPVGFTASPIVGLQNVSDTVFATATNGAAGATLYALHKADGSVKWSSAFTAPTESSPVAVYNEAGDAWIVQVLADGQVLLLDADTGAVKATLQLEGEVRASPAVYRDVLVISTTGSDPSYIYAITLE